MLSHVVVFALTIGSYKKELIDDELTQKMQFLKPAVYEFWKKKGYNGVYPNGPNEELWSQIVNGKNYILKKSFDSEPLSLCIKAHESFSGDLTVLDTKICSSVFDILS